MSEKGRWVKGQSGNKDGRPSSERALAKVLRVTGELDSYGEISNKMLLARMVWEALIWGKIKFAGGKSVDLTAREWLDIVKWVHSHVDGAYQPEPQEEAPKEDYFVFGPDKLTYAEMVERGRQEDEAEERRKAEAAVMRIESGAHQPEEMIAPEKEVVEDDPEAVRKAEAMLMRLVNEG